jgi:hypothetical protein
VAESSTSSGWREVLNCQHERIAGPWMTTLHMDKICILHEIESGNTARAFGTIKYLEKYPEGEKFMLSLLRH